MDSKPKFGTIIEMYMKSKSFNMKKSLFFIALALSSFAQSKAQVTLTAANMNPQIGWVFEQHYSDTTGINEGAPGAGVTWNFVSMTTNSTDTTSYIAPTGTPYYDSFSTAQVVIKTGTNYGYAKFNSDSCIFNGFGERGTVLRFQNPYVLFKYPNSYNNITTDFSSFVAYDSSFGYIFDKTTETTHYDSYGTLMLPTGNFTDVVRLTRTTLYWDSVYNMGFSFVAQSKSITHEWYKDNIKMPLARVVLDSNGSGTFYKSVVSYTKVLQSPTSIADVDAYHSLKITPNPASNFLQVSGFNMADNSAFAITNMIGNTVLQGNLTAYRNGADLQIPVNNLPAGVYFISIGNGQFTQKQRFVVAR